MGLSNRTSNRRAAQKYLVLMLTDYILGSEQKHMLSGVNYPNERADLLELLTKDYPYLRNDLGLLQLM